MVNFNQYGDNNQQIGQQTNYNYYNQQIQTQNNSLYYINTSLSSISVNILNHPKFFNQNHQLIHFSSRVFRYSIFLLFFLLAFTLLFYLQILKFNSTILYIFIFLCGVHIFSFFIVHPIMLGKLRYRISSYTQKTDIKIQLFDKIEKLPMKKGVSFYYWFNSYIINFILGTNAKQYPILPVELPRLRLYYKSNGKYIDLIFLENEELDTFINATTNSTTTG